MEQCGYVINVLISKGFQNCDNKLDNRYALMQICLKK